LPQKLLRTGGSSDAVGFSPVTYTSQVSCAVWLVVETPFQHGMLRATVPTPVLVAMRPSQWMAANSGDADIADAKGGGGRSASEYP
jgi:hypothetical protein